MPGCDFSDINHNLRLVTQLLPDCYNWYWLKRADQQIDIGLYLGLFRIPRTAAGLVPLATFPSTVTLPKCPFLTTGLNYNASDGVVAAGKKRGCCGRRIWTIAKNRNGNRPTTRSAQEK